MKIVTYPHSAPITVPGYILGLSDEYKNFKDLYHTVARLTADPQAAAIRFAHAVMGVGTELREAAHPTDDVNALEEAGDLLFFCALAEMALLSEVRDQFHAESMMVDAIEDTLFAPVATTGVWKFSPTDIGRTESNGKYVAEAWMDLLEQSKGWLGYGAFKKGTTLESLAALVRRLGDEVACGIGDDCSAAAAAVVRKLNIRYPAGEFSQESAINRDTDAERQALQG